MLLSWFVYVRDCEHLWSSLPLPPSSRVFPCRGMSHRNGGGFRSAVFMWGGRRENKESRRNVESEHGEGKTQ